MKQINSSMLLGLSLVAATGISLALLTLLLAKLSQGGY